MYLKVFNSRSINYYKYPSQHLSLMEYFAYSLQTVPRPESPRVHVGAPLKEVLFMLSSSKIYITTPDIPVAVLVSYAAKKPKWSCELSFAKYIPWDSPFVENIAWLISLP